jgi:predicted nucleotidyltransferase
MTQTVATRTDHYRNRAVASAKAAIAALAEISVDAVVTGSLARGKFGIYSDIDLLVTSCPRRLKYAIESIVEDILNGIPFDVIYLDELPPWKAANFTEGAIDASELR